MKISFAALCLGVLPLALSESVIVSYSKDTPQSVVDNAKQSIIDGGGQITHEYNSVINGFSAEAPEEAVNNLASLSPKHKPTIEKDETVGIQ